jgi:hypothetical protein
LIAIEIIRAREGAIRIDVLTDEGSKVFFQATVKDLLAQQLKSGKFNLLQKWSEQECILTQIIDLLVSNVQAI